MEPAAGAEGAGRRQVGCGLTLWDQSDFIDIGRSAVVPMRLERIWTGIARDVLQFRPLAW